jgi:hypothetical protein
MNKAVNYSNYMKGTVLTIHGLTTHQPTHKKKATKQDKTTERKRALIIKRENKQKIPVKETRKLSRWKQIIYSIRRKIKGNRIKQRYPSHCRWIKLQVRRK